jgi:YHS domain-containing protein
MSLSRRRLTQLILAGATVGVPLGTVLMPSAGRAQRVFAEDGVAVRGTDVVAYFDEGRPVPGRADITHAWGGATWRFASAANRDRFAADPERYAPAYGGFCAYAVSEGYTAPIDPAAWRVVDGRLFLNYDRGTQRIWERDIPGRIARGDANWPGLSGR